jgi:hypothetical protein
MDRYRIAPTRDAQKFGILDRETYEYCGLQNEDGDVVPLEWAIRAAAEAWLQRCYRTWQTWEDTAAGIAPKGWRPHPPEVSPFDPGFKFYS